CYCTGRGVESTVQVHDALQQDACAIALVTCQGRIEEGAATCTPKWDHAALDSCDVYRTCESQASHGATRIDRSATVSESCRRLEDDLWECRCMQPNSYRRYHYRSEFESAAVCQEVKSICAAPPPEAVGNGACGRWSESFDDVGCRLYGWCAQPTADPG